MGLMGCGHLTSRFGPLDFVVAEDAVNLTLSSIFAYASRPANYLELQALANSDEVAGLAALPATPRLVCRGSI